MKTNKFVLFLLPFLLASCSPTSTSSSSTEENKTITTEQAYENLQQDDMVAIKVTEYKQEGKDFYYRSILWDGSTKIPSLFLALVREDKTGKEDYSKYDGYQDLSLYRLALSRKNSDTITDLFYVQNAPGSEETAGYYINSTRGYAIDSYSYIFKGLSAETAKQTAAIREEISAELAKQEFILETNPLC